MKKNINFEDITLRCEVSTRGGGIEISLDTLGFPGEKMAAYQNYLGGGLLGRVCCNDTVDRKQITDQKAKKLEAISEQLKKYYFSLTNPDKETSPWEHQTYLKNQSMPKSGY